ncbi:MAG: hypothetical protein DCF16_11065 [Alphaproteobacteria bacterium]|nr:MAG: hypothetical protein DCF16_11065 [Alphaproteobacteria bacterium]
MDDWIDAINARGVFGRTSNDPAVRAMVDRSTAHEFARAMDEQFKVAVTNIRNGGDPPDILAEVAGRDISVELVELRRPAMRAFWSDPELATHIDALVDKKATHYAGWSVDALVLHTDELWITADLASQCLSVRDWTPRQNIRSAWLLLFADPSWPTQFWPLFRIYGDLS